MGKNRRSSYQGVFCMKTAIVHDWLMSPGGAEKVLDAIFSIYPSPIYTLLKRKQILQGTSFEHAQIFNSFIQNLPFASSGYRNYLPLFPAAIESFDLGNYDLILSSSHAVAKGVRINQGQLHICYCHTPMRYAWDLYEQYMDSLGVPEKWMAKWVLSYLRKWDLKNLQKVHHFIANSYYIAQRIRRLYGREATVIYPPIQTQEFDFRSKKENFYVTISRLVPYKRVDLIIEAFRQMPSRHLIVIGEGPEWSRLNKLAGKNVKLLGFQPDVIRKEYLSHAKGFVFAAEEDFGIAPVEAQAAGTPVIAYGKGGVKETVIERKTGVFFAEQTVESLVQAVNEFESLELDPEEIRSNVKRFDILRFNREFKQFVDQKWEEFCENRYSCRR